MKDKVSMNEKNNMKDKVNVAVYENRAKNFFKIALLFFLPVITWAEADDFEKKCKDPYFYSQVSEYFACETDISFDACKGLSLGGAAMGASATLLSSKITMPSTIAAFNRYTKLQDEYIKLKGQYWAAYMKAASLPAYINPFFRNKDHLQGKWAYEAMQKDNPIKLQQLEHEWYLLEKEKTRIEKLTEKFYFNKLNPHEMKWLPSQYDEKIPESLRSILAKNQKLWSDTWSLQMKVEGTANPQLKANYEAQLKKAKAELEQYRKTALKQNFFGPAGLKNIGKKSAIGALVAGGVASVPLAIQLVNDKLCGKLSKEASAYIAVSSFSGSKSCQASFNEGKEAELFLLDNEERLQLFEKNPALCASWVQASEKRMQDFPKVKASLTKCTSDSIGADVEIKGRTYSYEISNHNGKMNIKSILGVEDTSKVTEPLSIEWSAQDQNLTTARVKNSPTWASIDSDKRTMESINSLYFMNSGEQKPLSRQSTGSTEKYKAVELLSGVAEQTVALKQALPGLLEACGYISSSESATSEPSGTVPVDVMTK